MKLDSLKTLIELRILVGFLGEKDQINWWDSSFYSKSSLPFLNPLFPRTIELSRSRAVQIAAAIIHDEAIGVGEIYHLFRLPEHIETQIHTIFHNNTEIKELISSHTDISSAISHLKSIAGGNPPKSDGPVSIGTLNSLEKGLLPPLLASVYSDAFNNNRKSFPYITSN